MILVVSVVVAYLILGFSYAMKDLKPDVVFRPVWAYEPTLGKFILVSLFWPVIQSTRRHPLTRRNVIFSIFTLVLQMLLITSIVWGCIGISIYIFDNIILRVICSVILLIIGALFLLPFINIAAIPILMLILLPLNFLFPEDADTQKKDEKGE